MKILHPLGTIPVTTPALAHRGAHITPHGVEWMPVLAGLTSIAFGAAIMLRTRPTAKARK